MACINRRNFLWFALLPTVTSLPETASAHSFKHGAIAIGHAWALPTPLSEGQIFMPMINNGKTSDALLSARSGICSIIELRRNNRYDDLPYPRFELEPGKPFPMRPTARHLRLIGLHQPLEVGNSFSIILDFEFAGEIEILVLVEEKPGD